MSEQNQNRPPRPPRPSRAAGAEQAQAGPPAPATPRPPREAGVDERPKRKRPHPGQAPRKGPSLTERRDERGQGGGPGARSGSKRVSHGKGSRGFSSVAAGGRRRVEERVSGQGELFNRYHADLQWPIIQETAVKGLVLVSRLLLEGLHDLGWQETRVTRKEEQEFIFGFDNVWTLCNEEGRSIEVAPDESYRDLLYIAPGYERDSSTEGRELDRQILGSDKLLEQKAKLAVRKRLTAIASAPEPPAPATPTELEPTS